MTVEITCPSCNFSKTIPRDRIPSGVKWANCPRCKTRFEIGPAVPDRENGFRPSGGEPARAAAEEAPPWERRSETGIWQGIVRTSRAVLFSPAALFRRMPTGRGLKEPLAYGLLLGSLGTMFSVFWQFLAAAGGALAIGEGLWGPFAFAALFLAVMVLSPFLVVAEIFLTSGIVHLLLLVVRGGGKGFEATFRVVAYSQTTQILGLVPFAGGIAGGLWMLVVQIIGLKEIHESSYGRVLIALFLPLFLILALISAVLIPFLIGF